MKPLFNLLLLVFFVYSSSMEAQTNFREGYRRANPVPLSSDLPLAEKVKIHQNFLEKATQANVPLHRLYGLVYLFADYLKAHDFPEATRYLLQAETIAEASGNVGWQGWVAHRRGILLVTLQKQREAIVPYELAATLCATAGDSLCLGESLEQLGTVYSLLDDFEKAHQYYEQALPILEKYGDEISLGTILANFGGLLCRQDRPDEAIPPLERAAAIFHRLAKPREEAQAFNNLGESYYRLQRFDQAIAIFQQSMRINQAFNIPENLINNYVGLWDIYKAQGNFREALHCAAYYYELRDSILGVKTQLEIADLESRYHGQQQELALQKSQMSLGATQRQLERGSLFVIFLLLLTGFGLWRWRAQTRQAKQEHAQNQENLNQLTRILLEKNQLLTALEEQVAQQSSPVEGFEEKLYDQRILTDADWVAFKGYFDKAYPSYLLRLRTAYPALSEAEERLFLFIKLNLTRKEAAAILGISPDSVKKTRQRLRLRLGLGEEVELEVYIRAF